MPVSVIPEGQIVYGMQLQVQAQSAHFIEPWEWTAGADELATMARKADETGFHYLGVCDHVAVSKNAPMAHMGPAWYETLSTLGFLAAHTSRVRLLSNVAILGFRHPLVTAKQWITLDKLSKGRAILGIGVGWAEGEYDLLRTDFANRGRLANDALTVIRAVFDEEYPMVTAGDCTLDGTWGFGPRPVQAHIPVWIGGRGKPALRRVAEHGDGWIPQGTPKTEIAAEIAYIREHQARIGREGPLDIGAISEVMYVGAPSWDVTDRPTLAGSPEMIAERMREWKAMGVNHLQIRFRNRSVEELCDQMDAWYSGVAPLLND
jgi:probable F420-dependent oxidoreductase